MNQPDRLVMQSGSELQVEVGGLILQCSTVGRSRVTVSHKKNVGLLDVFVDQENPTVAQQKEIRAVRHLTVVSPEE